MNGKKIVGNGSKATLPNGKNLSDKIQENKTKNNLSNKSSGTKGTSTADNSSKNNNGKEKSKGQQSAQELGTEAARQALKKAAGTIPWTRWIPKGIRDKLIDKFMDSDAGQAAVEKGLKGLRTKIIIMIIVCVLGSLVLTLLGFVAIYAMFVAPVAWVGEVVGGVSDFFKSFGNWFSGNGWCANMDECQTNAEYKYYEALDKAVAKYKGSCEVNPELITATIFYGQMVSEEPLDLSASGDGDEYGAQENFNFIDVSEAAGKQNAKAQINKLLKVHLRGEGMDVDDLESTEDTDFVIDEDNPCSISSARYREYLINRYIDWAYSSVKTSERTKEVIADEILQMGGLENKGSNGSCSSSCNYTVGDKSISELKVQLLDNNGNKIEGQDLISFENYILGVTYGEIGPNAPAEAAKAQAIAARSYALTRAGVMNGSGGVKLEEVDGQWILYIRSSTNDQVYCDPDKGCGKRADGVFISDPYSSEVDPNADYSPKYGLAADAPLRSYVSEVVGVVAIDNTGNIVKTSYTSTQHNLWIEKANEGLDYTEILKGSYSDIATIGEGNCSALCSSASGPYTEWKQYNWPDVYMNNLSIKEAGCLTVSVAMQIARSGVSTPLGGDFSPATLVENYRKYLYTGSDNWYWAGITKVIPNFVWDSNYKLTEIQNLSDQQQIDKLLNGINAGCYYVVEVKSYRSGQHWVAIDTIKDGKIYMMDPASNCTVLNECVASTGYKYRIRTAQCYRVK